MLVRFAAKLRFLFAQSNLCLKDLTNLSGADYTAAAYISQKYSALVFVEISVLDEGFRTDDQLSRPKSFLLI